MRNVSPPKLADDEQSKVISGFHEDVDMALRDVAGNLANMDSRLGVTNIGNLDSATPGGSKKDGFVRYTRNGANKLGFMIDGKLYVVANLVEES